MIAQLDEGVPRDGSKLLLYMDDPETNYCEITGNRNGYLRATLEFLRAATVPLESGGFITPIDFNYLVPSQGGVLVKRLNRQDDVKAALPPQRQKTWKDTALAVGCLAIFLFLAVCAFLGIGLLGSWIFGK